MSKIFQKIKYFYHKIRHKKESYEKSGTKPSRDWKMIIILAQTAVFILAGVAYYYYIQIEQGKLYLVKKGLGKNNIQINSILFKKTVDDFNSRMSTFSDITSGKGIPKDPSI